MTDQGEIFRKTMLANGHDGMLCIVKQQNKRGRDRAIAVCEIKSDQLSVRDQAFCRGVIIEIGHIDLLLA